jgi:hypothetical protein
MDVRFRPLVWTGPRTPVGKRRSRYTFKAGWQDTLYKLEYELDQLKATEIVIEADFREDQIRIDGWPKSNQAPIYAGVKVSFNTPNLGRLEYATDVCEFWQHNVRSIALGLEALRAVDRYGITSGRQQYTGFKALPSANGDRRPAAVWVAKLVYEVGESQRTAVTTLLSGSHEDRRKIINMAKRKAHPDTGGSVSLYQLLIEKLNTLGVS